ncbi:ribosomal protein L24 [Rhizoctonia solani]|uniref:Ribosomal protein L24 n=1 Tax=Rhizoctonia solani TaxID=456999 RepID=A0A8H7IAN5_9AGAM|nr:ribosomal protein L24 [Rhizoctonia solani]
MKVEIDSFSGRKIYPSKGKLYVRGDSKVFRFSTSKSSSLFLQRKNPRKIAWTIVYRRSCRGDGQEAVAQDREASAPAAEREKARADAIAKAKADKKKKEDAKTKVKPAARTPATAPKVSKQQMKGGKGGR